MKLALLCVLLAVATAVAEDDGKSYYIERYPGDGMKQRPMTTPKKSVSDSLNLQDPLAVAGPSSTNLVTTGTNTTTRRAARYTSPRISSKEYAPSRLDPPKTRTVVLPDHKKKLPPSPKLSDKAGMTALDTQPAPATDTTNAPAASEPTK